MSTYADKEDLTTDDVSLAAFNADGVSLKGNDSVNDEIIRKLGNPADVKCCPTGTLEFAAADEKKERYMEDCCDAVTATVQALSRKMSLHPPKFLILYGSLRKISYSRKVAIEVGRILGSYGAAVKVFDPTGLPLFSMDIDPSTDSKVSELRQLTSWCEGMVWISPEVHSNYSAVFKNQVDWMPLSTGAIRPTQGKTCAVMQVEAGSQSFNTVNNLRVLGRWMRMVVIPNQVSIPRVSSEFDDDNEDLPGAMKNSSLRNRLVDVTDELFKYTLLLRDQQPYLLQRYSETVARSKKHLEETTLVANDSILSQLSNPLLVIDLRSAKERNAKKGGEAVPGSVHVPLNVNNDPQSVHITTKEEFYSKLIDAGVDLASYKSFITHCTSGNVTYISRAARGAALLRDLGYQNAYNGGDAINICSVLSVSN